MNRRKYIIPNVQFVYMTMPKNVCDDPNSGAPEVVGVTSTKGINNNSADDFNAPARIKLYF